MKRSADVEDRFQLGVMANLPSDDDAVVVVANELVAVDEDVRNGGGVFRQDLEARHVVQVERRRRRRCT